VGTPFCSESLDGPAQPLKSSEQTIGAKMNSFMVNKRSKTWSVAKYLKLRKLKYEEVIGFWACIQYLVSHLGEMLLLNTQGESLNMELLGLPRYHLD
jgi:hypothetical protein